MGPERYYGVGFAHRLEYVEDPAGVRYAYGVGERDVIYAGLDDLRDDAEHLAVIRLALEGIAEEHTAGICYIMRNRRVGKDRL
jgi:hypothetical protein